MADILIVDDNRDDCDVLKTMLEFAGHNITCAPNGREAVAQVIHHVPDVVLLDLLMPEMDGPTFLEVVRSYLRLHALPVVIYTGLVESLMVDHARALEAGPVLTKGKATGEEIVKALEEAVVRKSC